MSPVLRGLAAALAIGTWGLSAQAQGVDEFGAYGKGKRGQQSESSQDAAVELRFGRYQPEVDSKLGSTPFQTSFGNDKRFLFGFEADWQLIRIPHFGTIGPGFGWGLTKFGAKARFTNIEGTSDTETRIWIMPMHLVGVVRADVISRDFGVPLVPYAKLGFGYGLWWSSDGEKSAKVDGVSGKGASYGLTYALGGMFLLDILDEDDAASADGLTGINNSYLFAEWYRPQLDGFGSATVLDIGSSSWLVGVAMEM
ncbi:MAG TPA: MXAN_2562 family outer membrane beta-barrel protein [Polyangiaceae bacterium]|nr:MXAN_2562 family outer membrane beta-barrel protein [Polyangiaceae bacterium]